MKSHPHARSSQACITQALALLPDVLAPGQAAPDFADLLTRIEEIEGQQIVAIVAHWVTANADWLQHSDLVLHPLLLEEPKLVQFPPEAYPSSRCRQEALAAIPEARQSCVRDLLIELTCNTSDLQHRVAEEAMEKLNSVRWHPENSRTLLMECITGYVADPESWLDEHIAWAQRAQLGHSTPAVSATRNGGRLWCVRTACHHYINTQPSAVYPHSS